MAGLKNLRGHDGMLRNLNRRLANIKGASIDGLIAAADLIRADMDCTPPLIPYRTGRLRDSWFTEINLFVNSVELKMGFSAPYAAIVHESVGWNFGTEGTGAKFFEAAIYRNRDRIVQIIKDKASTL